MDLFPYSGSTNLLGSPDLMKTRVSKSEVEAEETTNHKTPNRVMWLVYSSVSTCDSDNKVFTRIVSDGVVSGIGVLLLTASV